MLIGLLLVWVCGAVALALLVGKLFSSSDDEAALPLLDVEPLAKPDDSGARPLQP